MVHNCRLTSKEGDLIFICSRCRACYVCRHKAVCFEDGIWRWKCRDGKFREVILDGRLNVGISESNLVDVLIDLDGKIFDWNEETGQWIKRN